MPWQLGSKQEYSVDLDIDLHTEPQSSTCSQALQEIYVHLRFFRTTKAFFVYYSTRSSMKPPSFFGDKHIWSRWKINTLCRLYLHELFCSALCRFLWRHCLLQTPKASTDFTTRLSLGCQLVQRAAQNNQSDTTRRLPRKDSLFYYHCGHITFKRRSRFRPS